MADRLLRWFYGVPNMVAIALALVGLGLFLGGVISGWLVPPIVVGLYLIGALLTPRPRGIAGLGAGGGGLDAGQIKSALGRIAADAQARLPDELAARVVSI